MINDEADDDVCVFKGIIKIYFHLFITRNTNIFIYIQLYQ